MKISNNRLLANLMPLLFFVLGSCSLTPAFVIPEIDSPEAYKEDFVDDEPSNNWSPAQNLDNIDKGKWWMVFEDGYLNALEERALSSNFSLEAGAARVLRARALVQANRFSYLPTLDLGVNAFRNKPSSSSLEAFGQPRRELDPYTLYSVQGTAFYEVDLFRRLRDNEEAYRHDADAQQALYANAALVLQADVAQNYFSIRTIDSERILLRDFIAIQEEATRIMRRRRSEGDVGDLDLARSESELAGTQADLIGLERRRSVLEHALAILLAEVPANFCVPDMPLIGNPPQIPPGLPSSLLQRRPDISAAISSMAASNRRIGVAKTAFFPRLVLTAMGGFQSTNLSGLFKWSNRMWSLGQQAGAALAWNVFDSGRNVGRLNEAVASYEETVANYKQQLLIAFGEVEDNLAAQRQLSSQQQKAEVSATAAMRTTTITHTRYGEGEINFFEVVDAWRTSLSAGRFALQIQGLRFIATIQLIRALGGGWEEYECL